MNGEQRIISATAFLLDMDGVLVRGSMAIDGSIGFVEHLVAAAIPFQIFTNNSRFTADDHAARLSGVGFPVTADHIFTSAMATAHFIKLQRPGASVFPIGEAGLTAALTQAGCRVTENAPDYVVLGESLSYHYEYIGMGARLVANGARFLATNPDVNGPTEQGLHPACGAVAALIQAATGKAPYFIGKPNPFMMRSVLDKLKLRAAEAVMVGDRMDTDVLAGLELGLTTALVLTGVTQRADIDNFAFRPDMVGERLADLTRLATGPSAVKEQA